MQAGGWWQNPEGKQRECGLHSAIDDAVEAVDGHVILAGHSGGGMLVTAATNRHPDKIVAVIWIAGMLLPNGENFIDLQNAIAKCDEDFGVSPHVVSTEDGHGTYVAPDVAAKFFLNDLNQERAISMAQRFTPQPNVGRRIPTHCKQEFYKMPKLYIQAKRDHSVIIRAHEKMCQNIEMLDAIALETGHCPHISQPDKVTAILSDWLGSKVL